MSNLNRGAGWELSIFVSDANSQVPRNPSGLQKPLAQSPSISRPYAKVASASTQSFAQAASFPGIAQGKSPQQQALDLSGSNFPELAGNGFMRQEDQMQSSLSGRQSALGQPKEKEESFPPLPGTKADGSVASQPKSDMDRYGLNGLSGVIKMENNDQTTVAIGTDLTNLGLNFNPTDEPLSKTFSSPWIDQRPHLVEPEFKLPASYKVPSVSPAQQKMQAFSEETLFYIFYTMPKDSMQEAAAVELTSRNWRYHKELKLWLTKDPLSEPIQQTAQEERGIYIFFDPRPWEKTKREYVLYYPDIA